MTSAKLTLIKGTPVAREVQSINMPDGILIPLSERFFDGTVAVEVYLPPNTVTVPDALLDGLEAARDNGNTKRAWEVVDFILAQLDAAGRP
jgi:hypothetical protein